MRKRILNSSLSVLIALVLILSNMFVPLNQANVYAEGIGTWDSPYTVAQAIGIQNNSIATVQGYIVGQPTSNTTVLKTGFTGDTAVAIAETPNETDASKMLYVQLLATPAYVRATFGLKTNPDKLGALVKCTGNLTPYFTPHAGLKNTSAMEKVNSTPISVTGVSIDKTEASIIVGETLILTATVQPSDASNKNVIWSSDNPSIAAVSNGVVTAAAVGTATITVTTEDGNKTAACNITVSEAMDTVGPEIKNITPGSGENTGSNLKPIISAEYTDAAGIDIASIKLYIDGLDVTDKAAITEVKTTYQPENDLNIGEHIARLEISDKCTTPNKAIIEWNFSVGELTYNFYFGQLHSHTNYSDGQGTPDDAYSWARDLGKADFFAITDHSNSFDNDTLASLANGSASNEWTNLKQTADRYNENGRFVAIAGYEMTWSGSTGGWGHINTFNTEGFLSRNSKINNKYVDLPMYYNEIKKYTESISQFNHPGSLFGDFNDFGFYDPEVDKVISLIEVGNGEGPIPSNMYFPSYELYTRALDKGWHVAPTNNQDNHKGNWVLANSARTVVLANQLNREAVYDALRNMRTYATEDSNLKIMYEVNGKVMGSSLVNPASLNISIKIDDPDLTDNIGKVSIISDGGVVAASRTFYTNSATWELTLDPQYTYYYVRVDQTDNNIAVTAPVWTGEMVPIGVAKVQASQNVYASNTPIDLTATVYNNSSLAQPGLNVEFYANNIQPENKIGEAVSGSIAPGGNSTASIIWVPYAAGSYTIYARTVLTVNGENKISTESTKVEVLNPEDITRVVIDAGHYNQYVNGDYAGKMVTLKSMLAQRKYMLYENKDILTAEDLNGAKILIITDPQSKDKTSYNLYKSLYSDAEVTVIKEFMDNGGTLIITSRADYDDKGILEEIYESANQGNKILEAIGSNLRFNDDEMIDKVSNGGQEFRLYFDDYTSSKYGLTRNIPSDLTYSAYSGCSVVLKNGGDDTKVDWVVKGHNTTETLDSDLQNDAIPVALGDVKALAAEVLPNGGKLIVAGTTFFSDFETAGDNLYSNKQVTDNILDWLMLPSVKTISEVRADRNNDNMPDLLGKGKVMVEGRVTAATKAAVNNTAFFDVMYIQDETAGITVFGVSSRAIPLGTKVRVLGEIQRFDGDTEIQISNETTDIEIIDPYISLVEPTLLSTADSMLESNEGLLVKVEGLVTSMSDNSLFVDDGTGIARVYVNGYIGDDSDNPEMLGKWDKTIKVGDLVSAVGLASEDGAGHRIRVRNTAEISKVKTPVTGVSLNKTEATITINDTLQLTATIAPEDATYKTMTWSSSNSEVATVDSNGLVKPVDGGTAVITVITEDGDFTAACEVTVIVPVTGIELDKQYLSLKPEAQGELKVIVQPENATVKKVIWQSSDETIATVDEKGVVTALKIGIAKITAATEDGNFTTECIVAVSEKPATEVRINKDSIKIKLGREEMLTALVGPGTADIKDVLWSTDSSIIELINKNDKLVTVKALELGEAIIMVTSLDGGFTDICEVIIIAE